MNPTPPQKPIRDPLKISRTDILSNPPYTDTSLAPPAQLPAISPTVAMAILGKRKAPESSVSELDANEIFRRHFEAQFAPLAPHTKNGTSQAQDDDNEDVEHEDADEDEDEKGGQDDQHSDNSEWGGLSGEEDDEESDGTGFLFPLPLELHREIWALTLLQS